MIIKGKITTGLKKGAYFMAQEYYSSKFKEELGFKPFAGTLNITIDESLSDELNEIKGKKSKIIPGENDFGSVGYIKAVLEDKIKGAIVFPAKTTHEKNYLEFIAEDELRGKLDLEDGDEVKLEIV